MAADIISLPTAAREPVGKQTHRGRYPKVVFPAWRLDQRRTARAQQKVSKAADKEAHEAICVLFGNLAGRAESTGAVVILRGADGKQEIFTAGSFTGDKEAINRALTKAAFDTVVAWTDHKDK